MRIRVDVRRPTPQEIRAELRLDVEAVQRAQVMALNRTARDLLTGAGREIREVYNIKLAAIRKASKILKASKRLARAELVFAGRRIPLGEFSPRAVNPWNVKGRKHRRRGGGVSVQILKKGGRKLVPGAFISALTSNNARGGGAAGIRAVFRRAGAGRYPIRNLRSVSIPVAAAQKAVADALLKLADQKYETNFDDALGVVLRR